MIALLPVGNERDCCLIWLVCKPDELAVPDICLSAFCHLLLHAAAQGTGGGRTETISTQGLIVSFKKIIHPSNCQQVHPQQQQQH